MLELKNVKKNYIIDNKTTFQALKGINVSFQPGELVSVIGESGSGKSTLMNVIGGLDLSFEGEVNLYNENIRDFDNKQIDMYRKNRIGFVFQSFNLISHLSILENVAIALTLSNVSVSERREKALNMLKEVGLENHVNKKPNQLSGGQKQRVAIARALINDPDVILADEPTGSLDSETSVQILEIIKKIAAKGKLVIMVTHSEKVAQVSSRVIRIADGQIVEDYNNEEVKEVEINKKEISNKQNLGFFSAIKLSINNMREKKVRNILVSFGASIGIMSVILMLSLGNGIQTYMTTTMNGYVNPLVVEISKPSEKKDDTETQMPMMAMMTEATPFTDDDVKKIEGIENVEKVEKGYTSFAFMSNTATFDDKEVAIMNTYSTSNNITSENIKKGSMPKDGEVLVSKDLYNSYDTDILNKKIKLSIKFGEGQVEKEFVVSGVYDTTANTTSAESNNTMVFLTYDDMSAMAKENDVNLQATSLYITADDKDNTVAIKNKALDLGYSAGVQDQMLDMFNEMINVMTFTLSGISGISLFVSSIMILVVLYISVVERTKEIGVLKAIGARRKDIKRIFTAEAFLIGLLSGVIGAATALLISLPVNSITNESFNFSVVEVDPKYIVFGIMVSIIVSCIAGLYPASKASKLDPVESLRRE